MSALADDIDKSPKGSLDAPVVELCEFINSQAGMYTTSSCSGRITLFRNAPKTGPEARGKGGDWLLIEHKRIEASQLQQALERHVKELRSGQPPSEVTFRFEPFILSVECDSLSRASQLLAVAQKAGMRESGITSVSRRVMLSVRSSLRLEVPLWDADGVVLNVVESVSQVDRLVALANQKMDANIERISKFERELRSFLGVRFAETKNEVGSQESSSQSKDAMTTPQLAMIDPTGVLASRQSGVLQSAVSLVQRLNKLERSMPELNTVIHRPSQKSQNTNTGSSQRCSVAGDSGTTMCWVLVVARSHTKVFKDALDSRKYLDKSLRITPHSTNQSCQAMPLTDAGAQALKPTMGLGEYNETFSAAAALSLSIPSSILQEAKPYLQWADAPVQVQSQYKGFNPLKAVTTATGNQTRDPKALLKAAAAAVLKNAGVPPAEIQQLVVEVPKRWEVLGDIVLLPSSSFASPAWQKVLPELWPMIASALKVQKVAIQNRVADSITRNSQAQIVFPADADGWVTHKENSVLFTFDVTQCMFSSGNGTEKSRIVRLIQPNEDVVDLYAGIGYFTLPILVLSQARRVYAVELNSHAVDALQKGLIANKIAHSRYVVFPGDNRTEAVKARVRNLADRVSCGLIPSSEDSWPTAVAALKPSGGFIHIHANVEDGKEKQWKTSVVAAISQLARAQADAQKRGWKVVATHVEKVKSYAPRIQHLVIDIHCQSAGSSDAASRPTHHARNSSLTHSRSDTDLLHRPPSVASSKLSSSGQTTSVLKAIHKAARSGVLSPRRRAVAKKLALSGKFEEALQMCESPAAGRTDSGARFAVQVFKHLSADQFQTDVYPARRPVVIRGASLGSAPQKWTASYLQQHAQQKPTSLHVSSSSSMDFVERNFGFEKVMFPEAVRRCASVESKSDEKGSGSCYIRMLGDKALSSPADFPAEFPTLAADFSFPHVFEPFNDRYFSSVLRVSSANMQLWTHYDVMDNFLCHVTGRKRVVLFPPSAVNDLYVVGSSSPVLNVDSPDSLRYPRMADANRVSMECILEPGDVLFIPALWFHNVTSLEFCVSVNIFFKHLTDEYYQDKDVYGNKDLVLGQRALDMGSSVAAALNQLPQYYRDFYARKVAALCELETSEEEDVVKQALDQVRDLQAQLSALHARADAGATAREPNASPSGRAESGSLFIDVNWPRKEHGRLPDTETPQSPMPQGTSSPSTATPLLRGPRSVVKILRGRTKGAPQPLQQQVLARYKASLQQGPYGAGAQPIEAPHTAGSLHKARSLSIHTSPMAPRPAASPGNIEPYSTRSTGHDRGVVGSARHSRGAVTSGSRRQVVDNLLDTASIKEDKAGREARQPLSLQTSFASGPGNADDSDGSSSEDNEKSPPTPQPVSAVADARMRRHRTLPSSSKSAALSKTHRMFTRTRKEQKGLADALSELVQNSSAAGRARRLASPKRLSISSGPSDAVSEDSFVESPSTPPPSSPGRRRRRYGTMPKGGFAVKDNGASKQNRRSELRAAVQLSAPPSGTVWREHHSSVVVESVVSDSDEEIQESPSTPLPSSPRDRVRRYGTMPHADFAKANSHRLLMQSRSEMRPENTVQLGLPPSSSVWRKQHPQRSASWGTAWQQDPPKRTRGRSNDSGVSPMSGVASAESPLTPLPMSPKSKRRGLRYGTMPRQGSAPSGPSRNAAFHDMLSKWRNQSTVSHTRVATRVVQLGSPSAGTVWRRHSKAPDQAAPLSSSGSDSDSDSGSSAEESPPSPQPAGSPKGRVRRHLTAPKVSALQPSKNSRSSKHSVFLQARRQQAKRESTVTASQIHLQAAPDVASWRNHRQTVVADSPMSAAEDISSQRLSADSDDPVVPSRRSSANARHELAKRKQLLQAKSKLGERIHIGGSAARQSLSPSEQPNPAPSARHPQAFHVDTAELDYISQDLGLAAAAPEPLHGAASADIVNSDSGLSEKARRLKSRYD